MPTRQTVTLHHVITVFNLMFNIMDGGMRAVAKKKTESKEDIYFTMQLAWQKLSNYYANVTPKIGMLNLSAHSVDPFRKLQSFRKLDKPIDINPENETSYTTQYWVACLKYVENEYCVNQRCLSIIKPEAYRATISSPPQWLLDVAILPMIHMICPAMINNTWSQKVWLKWHPRDASAFSHLLTAARLYFNSMPELPQHWGQINPNHNDYHSYPTQISSTVSIQNITVWWRQQEGMNPTYANLSNMARDISSIILHSIRVEAR